MKNLPLSSLIAVVVLTAMVSACNPSPSAKVQSTIDDLMNQPFDRANVASAETTVGSKWEVISDVITEECYGDLCSKTVYGLAQIGGGDTLRPAFHSITAYGDKILLEHNDWSAITNADLQVVNSFRDAMAPNDSVLIYWDGSKMGVLNAKLEPRLPMHYDSIELMEIGFLLEPNYVYRVRQAGLWGILTSKGDQAVPLQYEAIYPLMGYIYAAKQNGKFGMIASDGAQLAPFKYDSVYSGGLNHAIAVVNKKLGLLDMAGQQLTEVIYDTFSDASLYGCRCARKEGRYGVLSSAGKELSGFIYEDFRRYASVHDEMQLRKNGRWGFFDCKRQKEITPFIYDEVSAFYGYEANVLINGKMSVVKLED